MGSLTQGTTFAEEGILTLKPGERHMKASSDKRTILLVADDPIYAEFILSSIKRQDCPLTYGISQISLRLWHT